MTGSNNTSYLKEYGERLLQHGYPIIPIKQGFKFPKGLSGWEQINATENHLKKWLSNGFADDGVGIITKEIPAIDIDVYDKDIANLLVAWCEKNIGATVKRVGKAPKILLVYRTEKPIKKMVSTIYEDFLGLTQKIEILGDGQQFVAFAMHPDTGKPYEWVTEKNIADIHKTDLPVLTEKKAHELVRYFESIVPDDWTVVEKGQKGKEIDFSLSVSERIFLHTKPKVDISLQRLIKAVNMLDPNMGNDDWVKVGMALFHQFDGNADGFNIFNEWSSKGSTYDPNNIGDRWRSFGADLATTEPVTAATLIYMAKEAYKEKNAKKEISGGFQLVHASKILAKLGPINWQVKNYFEADTIGILFGDPGSYKSFIAMDIGIHCALGLDWHGNTVKQGAVIYVAGEGHGGFARRLAAFEKAYKVSIDESLPLYFSEQAANFYNEESALLVTKAIDAIVEKTGTPAMLIIDTLARNFGAGDENSKSDLNVFIGGVKKISVQQKSGSLSKHVDKKGCNRLQVKRQSTTSKNILNTIIYFKKVAGCTCSY